MNWFLSLDKPFSYHRVGYMFFICFICYLISSPEAMFTAAWFIYFLLFVALGIVSDAIVQYLVMVYAKKRCHAEIEEAHILENEQTMSFDNQYEESSKQYDEKEILKKYVEPTDHLSFMTVDEGNFVLDYQPLPEATFVVEPYGDIDKTKAKLEELPVKVTRLTPSGQMPFKDGKIDIVMCENSNYDKLEIQRVLKNSGYFIVNQNGTANLKEFLQIYMPFGMKGSWDAYSCAQTLEDIGMRIIEKLEDYGTIRFHSVQALHTYFTKVSPDIADI
ncbi:MAG: hypothetical protein RR585_12190, partial [Coprobacillus sp.]